MVVRGRIFGDFWPLWRVVRVVRRMVVEERGDLVVALVEAGAFRVVRWRSPGRPALVTPVEACRSLTREGPSHRSLSLTLVTSRQRVWCLSLDTLFTLLPVSSMRQWRYEQPR